MASIFFSKKKGKKKKGKCKDDRWVGFLIHHFCDDVIYTCNLFLEKNMDAIHPDTAKMFKKSKYPMVQMIGAGTHHKKKKKKKKAKSVCAFFSGQLINLISTLDVTEPYFCRAMKPNWNKSKSEWDDVLVEDQLRSGGLIEALRVLKLGYPTRVPYQRIWDKFHDKIKNPLVATLGQMGFAQAVLMAFGVDATTYELGLTKIFFKPAKAAVLDDIMASADKPMSAAQNELIMKFVQEKRTKQILGTCKVFLKLSLRIRFKRAKENLAKFGRVLGLAAHTILRHGDYAKNAMKIKAAQTIQSFFRAKAAMSLGGDIATKASASKTVFQAWRRFEERTKLVVWVTENCAAAKKRAEELANMSPEEKAEREEKRKAARAAKAAAMAKAAAEADAARASANADAEAAAAAAREAAMNAQNSANLSMEDADKIARQREAEKAEALRLAQEKAKRDKENSELWKLLHPQGSSEEEEYEDEETGEVRTRKVVDFKKEAGHGHMFTVYQPRKNYSPHERFVKVDFADGEPDCISWGSGPSRTIKWSDIKFVLKGIATATMQVWKETADDGHVFSVVSADKTLDCQASDDHSRDIWVDGITKMLGQSEEDRAKAQEDYNPNMDVIADVQKPREKTASQLETQKSLFQMLVKTCFRTLNHEGLYGNLDDAVQEDYKTDTFYQKALQTTPWRQWDSWIRSEIVAGLVSNGLVDSAVAAAHEEDVAKAGGARPPPAEPAGDGDCLIA